VYFPLPPFPLTLFPPPSISPSPHFPLFTSLISPSSHFPLLPFPPPPLPPPTISPSHHFPLPPFPPPPISTSSLHSFPPPPISHIMTHHVDDAYVKAHMTICPYYRESPHGPIKVIMCIITYGSMNKNCQRYRMGQLSQMYSTVNILNEATIAVGEFCR
jgi:hypothetical protein